MPFLDNSVFRATSYLFKSICYDSKSKVRQCRHFVYSASGIGGKSSIYHNFHDFQRYWIFRLQSLDDNASGIGGFFDIYHKNFQKYWIFRLQSLMIDYRKIRLSRWRNFGFFENDKNFQKIYLSIIEDGKSQDIASGTQDVAK